MSSGRPVLDTPAAIRRRRRRRVPDDERKRAAKAYATTRPPPPLTLPAHTSSREGHDAERLAPSCSFWW